jgi:hypothetical protein
LRLLHLIPIRDDPAWRTGLFVSVNDSRFASRDQLKRFVNRVFRRANRLCLLWLIPLRDQVAWRSLYFRMIDSIQFRFHDPLRLFVSGIYYT